MSLILDALNRSRQDADPVPGLATQHTVSETRQSGWLRYVPWVALSIALVLIAWLLLGRNEQAVAPASAETGSTVVPNGKSKNTEPLKREARSATPAASTAKPSQPIPPASASVGAKPAPSAKPKSAARSPAKTSAKTTAQPSPKASLKPSSELPQPVAMGEKLKLAAAAGKTKPTAAPSQKSEDIAQLYKRSQTANSTAAATKATKAKSAPVKPARTAQTVEAVKPATPIDIEEVLKQAKAEAENARLAEHPAPFINQLSQSAKDAIPTLMYQRHDYSNKRGQSKVVINGRDLRVRHKAAAGVTVEEILADSVVLSHRGTQFRLRALNSWVNL